MPERPHPRVFINYRREDAAGEAGRLYDALTARFGKSYLFMDVDAIQPGADFADAINQAVGSCDVVVTVIGKSWVSLTDVGGKRRLDDPQDLVRLEIQSALERKIRVVPALVQGAQMPRADQLPRPLARLAGRNAFEISHVRWQQDVERLISTLEQPTPQRGAALNNLPRQLTSFVGRIEDVAAVKQAMSTARLVTLTGTGGCGKTRLALQVAGDVLTEYPNGVWLNEFAPVTDPELVRNVVASALGVQEQPGQELTKTLITRLQGERVLLIMDNCEHLVTACADLAEALLRACPDLCMLATSREALSVVGEVSYRVPSLEQSEAVQLFIDRARLAHPAFALDKTNASAVAEVCRRLDGIPLAIELAAPRVRMMPPEEILDRLLDRFRLVTLGPRTVPSRHQTLQAAVDWSYKLLGEEEQILFNRLSVFAGGFTLDAAEVVCAGDGLTHDRILDLLSALVDKSLVVVGEDSRGGSRYVLLETLRQFGRERLRPADAATIQRQHAEYFTAFAETWSPRLRGPEQALGLDRLEIEHDNIRAALAWSVATGRGDLALRLVAAAWLFWYIRGYAAEGLRSATEVLDRFDLALPSRGEALHGCAQLAWQQRDVVTAEHLASEALALFEQQHDDSGRGVALMCLANCALVRGNLADAERQYAEPLQLLRASSNFWGASIVLNNLGVIARTTGRYADAEQYLSESFELGRRTGDPWRKIMALGSLGEVYVERGMPARAAEVLMQVFVLQRETHNLFSLAMDLENCSRIAGDLSEWEHCLQLAGAEDGIRRRFGSAWQLEPGALKAVEAARHALGPDVADAARRQGLAMSMDEAIEYALGWLESKVAIGAR